LSAINFCAMMGKAGSELRLRTAWRRLIGEFMLWGMKWARDYSNLKRVLWRMLKTYWPLG